eukprot:COSAG01_NODE_656_length_14462_cov_20.440716_4_plen_88_part_00
MRHCFQLRGGIARYSSALEAALGSARSTPTVADADSASVPAPAAQERQQEEDQEWGRWRVEEGSAEEASLFRGRNFVFGALGVPVFT